MNKPSFDVRVGTLHKTKKNGVLIIKDYISSSKVLVQFVRTGFTTYATVGSIRNGYVKDNLHPTVKGVGFVGVGEYSVKEHKKAYSTWHNMLTRCYCFDYQKRFPTYIGCLVTEQWHNFQHFCDWYYDNYPKTEGDYHLDKDIKIEGNKIYNPETCMFVKGSDNMMKATVKHYKFKSPCGDIFEVINLASFCRENNLLNSAMCNVHSGKAKQHVGWVKA